MLDNIPPSVGIPVAIVMWLILLAMILRERRRLTKALKERPSLKIYDEKSGNWISPRPQPIFDQEEWDDQQSVDKPHKEKEEAK